MHIWIQKAKNYHRKAFQAIFTIVSILVIRSAYTKPGQFSIIAVFQNIWDLHKFGLQIWIQNIKITLWKNFGQFFRFHRFVSAGPRMRNKVISQYQLYFKIYGIYKKFGFQIWIQNTKITLWKNFGKFFWFHRFRS